MEDSFTEGLTCTRVSREFLYMSIEPFHIPYDPPKMHMVCGALRSSGPGLEMGDGSIHSFEIKVCDRKE